MRGVIAAIEMELKQTAGRCSELVAASRPIPNGASLQLGALGLLFMESSWGWLGVDGQLVYPPHKDVEINEQVQREG